MMTKSEREEMERLLRNYLLWLDDADVSGNGGVHPMWRQAARGKRAAPSVPMLQADAQRVHRALKAMPKYFSELLAFHHFEHGTTEDKAASRKMVRVTYWRWVTKAEIAFMRAYKSAHTFAHSAPDAVADDAAIDAPKTSPKRKKKRKQSTRESRASASDAGR